MQIGRICYPIEVLGGSYEIDAMDNATVGTKEADAVGFFER